MNKLLGLFVVSCFSSAVFAGGTCQVYTAKATSFLNANSQKTLLGTLSNASYGACVEAAATELSKGSTASVHADYATNDGNLKSWILVVNNERTRSSLSYEQKGQACYARAGYRNLLRASFSSHEGRALNSKSVQEASPAECFKAAGEVYINELASGQSLSTLSLAFWLGDQVLVKTEVETPFENAAFVRETFNSAL